MQSHRTSSNKRLCNRAKETFEGLGKTWENWGRTGKAIEGMCLTERLHIRFTTWEAFERAVDNARNNYRDKFIHGEIVVELR